MFASSLRHSDRKAAQILGVTLTRDNAANTTSRLTHIIHVLKGALRHKLIPSGGPGSFRWDISSPFATPDPTLQHIQVHSQTEIVRTESIAPDQQDPLDGREDVFDFGNDTASLNGRHEEHADVDAEDDTDIEDKDDTDIEDGDDTDMEDEDQSYGWENTLAPIALPRLLAIPVRFIPSPTSPADDEEEEEVNYTDAPAPRVDLAQVYNDMAEEEERAARRARRDEYRSRQKVLAVLGREASSAL